MQPVRPDTGAVLASRAAGRKLLLMTWGISGRQFLLIYALAVLAVLVGNAWLRRRPIPQLTPVPADALPPGVDELAYLSGGIATLGLSALVALHERGATSSPGPHLVVAEAGGPGETATLAQRALYERLARRASSSVRDTSKLLGGSSAVRMIRGSLVSAGLIPHPRLRARNRLGALAFIVLLVVGVVRVVAGITSHHPVEYLILLMVGTVFVAVRSLRLRPLTAAGRLLLRDARAAAPDLRTASLPGDRALAVALFGVDALWFAEPALADELGFATVG